MPAPRILIFIVAFNASKTIKPVLDRIPKELFTPSQFDTEILIIDDCSSDDTYQKSLEGKENLSPYPITVLRNPKNLGYGGNQKLGYQYAIEKGFDFVALLHGDGQYAPEALPTLLQPLIEQRADAVFGSRMMEQGSALKGGMPIYKYIGNIILTKIQNLLAETKLSEWHSGYRLYSVEGLKTLPIDRNENGFEFDTDIIIQFAASGRKIVELPIPTYYGDEICHVNGVSYGLNILGICFQFWLQKRGLLSNPKFELTNDNNHYTSKFDFVSSHSLALAEVQSNDICLLFGCGPRPLVEPFLAKAKSVSVVDQYLDPSLTSVCANAWQADLNTFQIDESTKGFHFNKVFALDVIEHLADPELFLEKVRATESLFDAEIVITVPNVAFLPVRLMLLFGQFNYGKKGILDKTHTRLFTAKSLRRALVQSGYEIRDLRGIPAPIPLALGRNWFGFFLLRINQFLCSVLPGVFSYQFLAVAQACPNIRQLLQKTIEHSRNG